MWFTVGKTMNMALLFQSMSKKQTGCDVFWGLYRCDAVPKKQEIMGRKQGAGFADVKYDFGKKVFMGTVYINGSGH